MSGKNTTGVFLIAGMLSLLMETGATASSIVGWGDELVDTDLNRQEIVAISAGVFHNLALNTDGTIIGWGDNENGRADSPPGANYTAIAAGGYHSLALKTREN